MSARSNDDRRVAEIWETASTIQWRISNGLYSESAILSPASPEEEMAGEALAYSLQRIGEEASRLTFETKRRFDLPWDQIAGLRNVPSHDYPGISWDQIWETASHDIEPLMRFCEEYSGRRGATVEELVENNHASLAREDEKHLGGRAHRWDDSEA